jgi:hypothetical protein
LPRASGPRPPRSRRSTTNRALHGVHRYEWTSNAGGGDNLHRNIIYRDNKDKADQVLPYTTFQSENPEDLWKWMTEWEKTTGGKILAIPHNGNLSNGRMFALTTFSGDPLTKAWADARQRWEPLFEAIQMKGQSESHPSLSPTDDFAAYELWDRGNLTQTPKKPGMIAGEYAREALKNGLKVEQDLGTNPFKFGMAGGTDTHNGLVAAEEDNFFAKFPSAEPRPDRWDEDAMNFGPNRIVKGWEMTAAGYTAVWATGNTRAELWDAMMRRETYATSGPRMIVRFFGGYDFTQADATRTPAVAGYAKGVPMGGDLPAAPAGKAPTFLVAALKDRFSGNLDRIQIIKGWLGKDGKPQEKIYDVVWGNKDRRRIVNGKLTPVGTPWTSPPPRGPTPSAIRNSSPSGRTRTSIRRSARSTTRASSRSRRRAGPRTTRRTSRSRSRTRRCR